MEVRRCLLIPGRGQKFKVSRNDEVTKITLYSVVNEGQLILWPAWALRHFSITYQNRYLNSCHRLFSYYIEFFCLIAMIGRFLRPPENWLLYFERRRIRIYNNSILNLPSWSLGGKSCRCCFKRLGLIGICDLSNRWAASQATAVTLKWWQHFWFL